ncbi:MAG: hypothetical protein WCP85_13765 [Mariniphaga sp.]
MFPSIKKCPFLFALILFYSCSNQPSGNVLMIDKFPKLEPDYSGLTIPPNIAPLNFMIKELGSAYSATFSVGSTTQFKINSGDGKIRISESEWKNLLINNIGKELKVDIFVRDNFGKWSKFKTVANKIASEPIDKFLFYRLIHPGYESWSKLSINQRNLENFDEKPLIENSVADDNCVNCHAFNNGKTDDFLFHMRGSLGGTYFYSNGKFTKVNLKTKEMKNGAVYPRWHPSGKFVAFSSNKIVQQFHSSDNNKVEVSDLESSLLLYDKEKNTIMDIDIAGKDKSMDTYPEWSPDGKILYFCRAEQIGKDYDYSKIRYGLYRATFDPGKLKFGEPELIFDAGKINKSMSFPRCSPDGKFLVFTLADYGCFPIWHKEADLYQVDLQNLASQRLDLNSDFTDSYHSWSSNSKWLIFSSKRMDGLTGRPFIAYMDGNGNSSKPFVMPQEDPEFYMNFLKSYNIPEFSTFSIDLHPGDIRELAKSKAIQTLQGKS